MTDLEVNSEDIQAYVESQIRGNTPPIKPSQAINPDSFIVSQEDYIAYLIAQKDKDRSDKKKLKRSVFWLKLWQGLMGGIKLILGAFITLALCWGFYFIVWFVQSSIYFHRVNIPVIP